MVIFRIIIILLAIIVVEGRRFEWDLKKWGLKKDEILVKVILEKMEKDYLESHKPPIKPSLSKLPADDDIKIAISERPIIGRSHDEDDYDDIHDGDYDNIKGIKNDNYVELNKLLHEVQKFLSIDENKLLVTKQHVEDITNFLSRLKSHKSGRKKEDEVEAFLKQPLELADQLKDSLDDAAKKTLGIIKMLMSKLKEKETSLQTTIENAKNQADQSIEKHKNSDISVCKTKHYSHFDEIETNYNKKTQECFKGAFTEMLNKARDVNKKFNDGLKQITDGTKRFEYCATMANLRDTGKCLNSLLEQGPDVLFNLIQKLAPQAVNELSGDINELLKLGSKCVINNAGKAWDRTNEVLDDFNNCVNEHT